MDPEESPDESCQEVQKRVREVFLRYIYIYIYIIYICMYIYIYIYIYYIYLSYFIIKKFTEHYVFVILYLIIPWLLFFLYWFIGLLRGEQRCPYTNSTDNLLCS